MKYAMVLRNRVISVETSDTVPIYPPDAHGNQVIPVQCNESVVIGMCYNENTNSFYEPPEPEPPQPTQLDSIEQTQLLIMEAMADQYEQRLETDLMMMDAQATTFEAVLALTEGVV